MIARCLVSRVGLGPAVSVGGFVRRGAATSSASQKAGARDLVVVDESHLKEDGFVICNMNQPPVNKLNLQMLTTLRRHFDEFEKDKRIKGVILASTTPKVFSAGLDITSLYQSKLDAAVVFWKALQDYWISLYGSNKVYIAAINGHAPAGGCLKAISCDYRIMAKGPYQIGLNETILGVPIPFYVGESMINVIGRREGEMALQLGTMYSGEEALRLRLVDELVEPKDLMPRSIDAMRKWCKIPTEARELTKKRTREDLVKRLVAIQDAYAKESAEFILQDFTQKQLGAYWNSLKKPKK